MDRRLLTEIASLLRPHATRVANMIVRGVVQLADDSRKMQLLQFGGLAGQTVDRAEHFQQYGFSSVPLSSAEVIAVFPNGDQSHPIVIASSDRRYRPVGGEPGQITIYHYSGAKIEMKSDGKVVVNGATVTGPTAEGVVVGTGIDPFTGQTYNSLGSSSSNLYAKK